MQSKNVQDLVIFVSDNSITMRLFAHKTYWIFSSTYSMQIFQSKLIFMEKSLLYICFAYHLSDL